MGCKENDNGKYSKYLWGVPERRRDSLLSSDNTSTRFFACFRLRGGARFVDLSGCVRQTMGISLNAATSVTTRGGRSNNRQPLSVDRAHNRLGYSSLQDRKFWCLSDMEVWASGRQRSWRCAMAVTGTFFSDLIKTGLLVGSIKVPFSRFPWLRMWVGPTKGCAVCVVTTETPQSLSHQTGDVNTEPMGTRDSHSDHVRALTFTRPVRSVGIHLTFSNPLVRHSRLLVCLRSVLTTPPPMSRHPRSAEPVLLRV